MITLWTTKRLLRNQKLQQASLAAYDLVKHQGEVAYYKNLLRFYMKGKAWGYRNEFWNKALKEYLYHRDKCNEIVNSYQ